MTEATSELRLADLSRCFEGAIPIVLVTASAAGVPNVTYLSKAHVVDDERSLITSANFTDRAQTRNIEAGVLIEDRGFSEELAGHWRQLVSEGLVRKYLG